MNESARQAVAVLYALVNDNGYGREAVRTLIARVENLEALAEQRLVELGAQGNPEALINELSRLLVIAANVDYFKQKVREKEKEESSYRWWPSTIETYLH